MSSNRPILPRHHNSSRRIVFLARSDCSLRCSSLSVRVRPKSIRARNLASDGSWGFLPDLLYIVLHCVPHMRFQQPDPVRTGFQAWTYCFRNAFFFEILSPTNSRRSQPAVRTTWPLASVVTKSHSKIPTSPATITFKFSNFPSGNRSKESLHPATDIFLPEVALTERIRSYRRMVRRSADCNQSDPLFVTFELCHHLLKV